MSSQHSDVPQFNKGNIKPAGDSDGAWGYYRGNDGKMRFGYKASYAVIVITLWTKGYYKVAHWPLDWKTDEEHAKASLESNLLVGNDQVDRWIALNAPTEA